MEKINKQEKKGNVSPKYVKGGQKTYFKQSFSFVTLVLSLFLYLIHLYMKLHKMMAAAVPEAKAIIPANKVYLPFFTAVAPKYTAKV